MDCGGRRSITAALGSGTVDGGPGMVDGRIGATVQPLRISRGRSVPDRQSRPPAVMPQAGRTVDDRMRGRSGDAVARVRTAGGRRAQSSRRMTPIELALDPHVGIELRRVVRVGGLQADSVLLAEEPLEGDRVLLDLGDHDVAVARRLLRPDDHEVPVRDVRLDHRVAADAEHVRVAAGREDLRHRHRLRHVLVGLDRPARGDLADRSGGVCDSLGCDWGVSSRDSPSRSAAVGVSRIARDWCGAALEVSLPLEDLEVVMDGGRGGKVDGLRDLAHGRRIAARAQGRGDVRP